MNRIIDPRDFIKEIDNVFWKHIASEGVIRDVVNFQDIEKNELIGTLAYRINKGTYRPCPGKIIGFPKNKGILRPVMHLTIEDKIVYYYCVKKMQDDLVEKIREIPHMYGGFRITEKVNKVEEDIDNIVFDTEYEGFNKTGFRKEWSDYQKIAKGLCDKNYSYYLHLDIAHFYDAIPLKRLESHIRKIFPDKNICDLLFYFLKNIKKDYGIEYIENDVGIPQEDTGEMSRLLANFYLHEFDEMFSKDLLKLFPDENQYEYIRYADDLWIAYNGSESFSLLISQSVVQCLAALGLHLNEAKTRKFTNNEFYNYWEFENWDYLFTIKENQIQVFKFLKSIYPGEGSDKDTRWFSIFNYGLKCLQSLVKKKIELNIEDLIWLTNAILDCPKLFGRNGNQIVSMLSQLTITHVEVRNTILDYLKGDRSVYPVVHYSLWYSLFNKESANLTIVELERLYYQTDHQELWWYRKCIYLHFLANFGNSIDYREYTDKLVKHIKNIYSSLNEIERRYSIRLFLSLSDMRGQEVIEQCFAQPQDKTFKNYIQSLTKN